MGVPPFKETPIQLVATKLEPNMTHMWEDSTHQLEDHFPPKQEVDLLSNHLVDGFMKSQGQAPFGCV